MWTTHKVHSNKTLYCNKGRTSDCQSQAAWKNGRKDIDRLVQSTAINFITVLWTSLWTCHRNSKSKNKFAQSNLGEGRVAGLAHTYAVNCPLVTMTRSKFAPKVPLLVDRSPNPTTYDPSDLWCQRASGSDLPFFHNALDRPMHRPTDRPRESLITVRRCATRATRPTKKTQEFSLE